MTTVEKKFNRIDQSKLTKKAKEFLQKVKSDTDNFTNKEVIEKKKVSQALDAFIKKFPDSVKPKAKTKKPETKKPETNKPKAKKTSKQLSNSIKDLRKLIENDSVLKGFKNSTLSKDAKLKAKPRGKRRVTNSGKTTNQYGTFDNKIGRVYYENRENRSDRYAPKFPKNKPLLEKGGFIAIYDDRKAEIKADTLYQAKKKAIQQLKVPKNKVGLLAIVSKDSLNNEDFRFLEQGGDLQMLDIANSDLFEQGGELQDLFEKLSKGSELKISYNSVMSGRQDANLLVKSKRTVAKGKPNETVKITFEQKNRPNAVNFYAYKRTKTNHIGFAKGDLAISDVKVVNSRIMFENGGKTDTIVAETIIQQLGGMQRLRMFTGAHSFVALKNGVVFKIKNRSINYIKITLNGLDLYNVTFAKTKGADLVNMKEFNNIYADTLVNLFETQTGMFLSFEFGGSIDFYAKGGQLNAYYSKMVEKLGKEGAFERVLKDSQFARKAGFTDYDHNRLNKSAIISDNKVFIYDNEPKGDGSLKYSNKKTFTSPRELAEYLDEKEIFAKGGKTKERPKSALMRDRKYFNQNEAWERQYSKNKPKRKGYKMAEGGSLEGHGLKEGDEIIEQLDEGFVKVKDQDGFYWYIDLSDGARHDEIPLPFKKGGEFANTLEMKF